MVLDIPVADLMEAIGHDGSEIVFSGAEEPRCRRGHHVQECVEQCLKRGYAASRIELFPVLKPYEDSQRRFIVPRGRGDNNWTYFTNQIQTSRGVLEGSGKHCEHAVVYDHGRIIDPDGGSYKYSTDECERRGFYGKHLWRVDKINEDIS